MSCQVIFPHPFFVVDVVIIIVIVVVVVVVVLVMVLVFVAVVVVVLVMVFVLVAVVVVVLVMVFVFVVVVVDFYICSRYIQESSQQRVNGNFLCFESREILRVFASVILLSSLTR